MLSLYKMTSFRSSMAIVTQDALLFSGTVRENLDPCGESLDSQVWQALKSCHLAELVQTLGGLTARIEEAGKAMSSGERQLFCLARALLCRTKVCFYDCHFHLIVYLLSVHAYTKKCTCVTYKCYTFKYLRD